MKIITFLKIENCKLKIGVLAFLFSLSFFFPSSASAAILGKPPNNLNLVGYWSFNENAGSLAGDASGNGSTGTLTNGPTWTTGLRGGALSLDDSDDYVTAGDQDALDFGTSDFTLSAWIKSPGSGLIVSKYSGGAGYDWRVETNILTFVVADSGGGTEVANSGGTNLNDGLWHHVVVTADRDGNATSYVDGAVNGSAGSIATRTGSVNNSDSFTIGIRSNLVGPLGGKIDEVRAYTRVLTAAQVYALYKSGATIRKTPNQKNLLGYWSFDENTGTVLGNASGSGSFNGTITGATWTSLGKKGSALSFDRVGDYVNMGGIVLTGTNQPFTFSAWVNPANLTDSWKTIMAGTCTGFDVTINGAGLNIGRNCGGAGVFYSVYTLPAANRWYHIVAVYDGTNINAYVDGVYYAGGAVSYDNSSTYYIGSYNGADELFNGKIDEVYLWNRALSASEILALYTSNSQKINSSQNSRLTSGLVGLWSFNGADISNGVALDRSGQGNNGNLIAIATSTFYDAGKVGQGFNFDGTDDYVNLGNVSALNFERTSPFSVSVWAKTDITATDRSVIAKGYYNTGGWGVVNIDTDQIRFFLANSSSNRLIVDVTPSNYYTGIWANIIFTYDGTSSPSGVKAYVNGQSVTVDTVVDSLSATTQTNTALNIGGAEAGRFFDGMLDEVRVYNRVLTAAEAKQLYDMGR